MQKNNFQIIITNHIKPDQDKNLITKKLAALFKIDEQKAAQLLLKPQTLIKDNLDEATANKYLAAIKQTGADCKIINKADAETDAEDLPQIVELPKSDPVSDPVSPTSRGTTRSNLKTQTEPELSLIARDAKNEKETREKLASLQNASNDTLCPECGTIRGSVDALCMHCGYNPAEAEYYDKSQVRKKPMLYGGAIILVLAVALALGYPSLQKMLADNKVKEDLQLAFDTRKRVTEFIELTGFFPNQNMDANLPDSIQNESIESIILSDNGTMTVTLRATAINASASQTLIFKPKRIKNVIAWNCMEGTLRKQLRPELCTTSAQ